MTANDICRYRYADGSLCGQAIEPADDTPTHWRHAVGDQSRWMCHWARPEESGPQAAITKDPSWIGGFFWTCKHGNKSSIELPKLECGCELVVTNGAAPQPGGGTAGEPQVCDKQFHMYVWSRLPRFIAVAQAENVERAREAMLDEIGTSHDGSCPEREAADKWVRENTPSLFHFRNAEFALTDSAELREQELLTETLSKKLAAACSGQSDALGDAKLLERTKRFHEELLEHLEQRCGAESSLDEEIGVVKQMLRLAIQNASHATTASCAPNQASRPEGEAGRQPGLAASSFAQEEALRELTNCASEYFNHYLQDEAAAECNCPCGEAQHRRAKELMSAIVDAKEALEVPATTDSCNASHVSTEGEAGRQPVKSQSPSAQAATTDGPEGGGC